MIDDAEELEPARQRQALGKAQILRKGRINLKESRCAHDVLPQITARPRGRYRESS